jgi:hypothetical protein
VAHGNIYYRASYHTYHQPDLSGHAGAALVGGTDQRSRPPSEMAVSPDSRPESSETPHNLKSTVNNIDSKTGDTTPAPKTGNTKPATQDPHKHTRLLLTARHEDRVE